MQDSYEFEYDSQIESYEDDESRIDYATIEISVSLASEKPRMYRVKYFVRGTPRFAMENVDDMFHEVEHKLLADLAADGVTRSMLIYP